MHWKEQLKAEIESLKDEDYRFLPAFREQRGPRSAVIHIDLGPEIAANITSWHKAIQHVNDRDFCGVGRGKLMLTEIGWDSKFHVEFCLRKTIPWNVLPDYETGEFREIRDSRGNSLGHYFDFDSLP